MGGGIGMGNTCKPMAVSFQCMTKFTTNKKKSGGKKKNTRVGCHFLLQVFVNTKSFNTNNIWKICI